MEPELLLLDEPLSNLDAKLREKMRFELKRLQRELKLTTVYVTHDQSEALALSHEIAVMSEGRIVQVGSPREIYERPRNQFVADFVGTTNFLEGSVIAADAHPPPHRNRRPQAVPPKTFGGGKGVGFRGATRGEVGGVEALQRERGEGVVDQKVFIGEAIDFQVKVGNRLLLARAHPRIRTPINHAILFRNPSRRSASRCARPSEKAAAYAARTGAIPERQHIENESSKTRNSPHIEQEPDHGR